MRDHRELPAFQHADELMLAVHETACHLPGYDPSALGARMEAAAHAAAAAVARACAVPNEQVPKQIDEASRRLREISYYVDIAQRLGYLSLEAAAELLERQTLVGVEVNALAQDEDTTVLSWNGENEPAGQPSNGSPVLSTATFATVR